MNTMGKLGKPKSLSQIKKEWKMLRVRMDSRQIPFIIENFADYMGKEVDEISMVQQDYIFRALIVLEKRIEKRTKSHSSGSLMCSNSLHFSPVSRKDNFNLIENIQGPLKDDKKLEFIKSVKNILEELLSSEVLRSNRRGEWTTRFCIHICHIPKDIVLSWIALSKSAN